ncbi:MAG TPA: hypothetical protein VFP65_06750 [Anaeromyxobacteraceae bacterium]|nr:hypothetical protein [Anaeromyxobacteraceae bacterium]
MRRAGRPLALALALAGAAGCNAGFAPQWRVDDLRILSARVEVVGTGAPTFADPDAGETVRLSALVANPRGRAGVHVRWKACLPVEGQVSSPCLDPAILRDPARLDTTPGVLDLGSGESVTVTLPPSLAPLLQAILDEARQDPPRACTIYAEVPVLALVSAGGTTRIAAKTVRATPWHALAQDPPPGAYVRNTNPVLGAVRAGASDTGACSGGVPVARPCASDADCGGVACVPGPGGPDAPGACADAMPDGRLDLCARVADPPLPQPDPPRVTGPQVYFECRSDGSHTSFFEGLTWQWYATGGVLERTDGSSPGDLGDVTGQVVRFTRPEGAFTLWLILRDGRGGEDWIRRDYR